MVEQKKPSVKIKQEHSSVVFALVSKDKLDFEKGSLWE